jgi:mRNA interferase RelE/StbE
MLRGLPEKVAAAVAEFMTGTLLENPHRIGKPLHRELAGYHGARRGVYRVVYKINDKDETVQVTRIEYRGAIYYSGR